MPIYPKISVVTPSYNRKTYLEKTILSVLEQNYPNLEYIVMDGGSTDGSVEVIKKYADRLAYWVSEPDKGQSDALNKGFQKATGDILAELDTDDLYLPGTLHTIAEYFAKHPDVEFVYGDLVVIDEEGRQILTKKTIPYDYKSQLYGGSVVPQPSSFWRGSVFEKAGRFDVDLHYNMDVEFFTRCGAKGVKFGHLPRPLACFRVHTTSKTINLDKVAAANKALMETYVGRIFKNEKMNDGAYKFLRWFYRAKIFIIRVFTRGDIIPYKHTFLVQQVSKKTKE
jgi:glycosyltransferase involved in cell wall biosynthesis